MDIIKLKRESWLGYTILPCELKVNKELFKELWDMHPQEYGKIKIMGKVLETPRWQQSFGKDYKFSGMEHKSLEIKHPYLIKLLKWVNKKEKERGERNEFNGILINWYSDGCHYIGHHSDDEKDLIKDASIYSFSFGQEREFIVKSKDKIETVNLFLEDNSLVIMGGKTQKYYTHSIPKRSIKSCSEKRINITIRSFKN